MGFQLAPDFLVAVLVAGDFGRPEVGVGFGDRVVFAVFVAVPEAAVDEDDGAVFGEDDVGGAGEALDVYSIAEAQVPEGVAQAQFRLCGGGMDLRHSVMPLSFCHCIGHGDTCLCKNTKSTDFAQRFIIFCISRKKHGAMKEEINCLKVILADKNKTSKWLAEQLGRDQATVSKWCTNRVQPSLETLKSIADLLGVELKDLLR